MSFVGHRDLSDMENLKAVAKQKCGTMKTAYFLLAALKRL